jgi:adenine-specific DNA-methyltransferase
MNKQDLISKIKQLDGVTQDERAYLINLVNTKKKYGLVWEDKPEDVEEQLRDNLPVLKEVKDKAIINGEDNPNHILIEGDNLHALTALTFTHEGKVDVIYIDPPYNTGNKDFKYNDTFVDKEDSYRHSKWLSFMDKRLRIAKRLLSETGVIFMSIDDNENAQLKLLCDEIFYEKNLISDVIWQSRKSVSNDTFISLNHNYTLIYAKDISYLDKNNFRLPTSVEKFDNSDNDPRGPWVADPFDAPNLRPNLTYAIINPNNGKEFWPPKGRCWRTGEDEYLKFLADNRIVFGKKGETKPQLKRFLDFAVDKGATSISIWSDIETTTNGTQQLEDILGSKLFMRIKG